MRSRDCQIAGGPLTGATEHFMAAEIRRDFSARRKSGQNSGYFRTPLHSTRWHPVAHHRIPAFQESRAGKGPVLRIPNLGLFKPSGLGSGWFIVEEHSACNFQRHKLANRVCVVFRSGHVHSNRIFHGSSVQILAPHRLLVK